MSTIVLKYDVVADVLFIPLSDRQRHHTVEIRPGTYVHATADGIPVGIEVHHPQRQWPVDEVLAGYHVPVDQARGLRAYFTPDTLRNERRPQDSANGASAAVALWYVRYSAPRYELFGSEQEAASFAAYMHEEGEWLPVGVQFPDGRLVKSEDWTALAVAERQLHDEHDRRKSRPLPETKHILDPFSGKALTVDANAPEWIGAEYRTNHETKENER